MSWLAIAILGCGLVVGYVFARRRAALKAEASLTDWIMAIATVCILFASVVQAVAIFKQYREMQGASKQTDDMLKLVQAQIGAANRLADEANRANQNGVMAERPWIGLQEIQFGQVGSIQVINLLFANSGQRPGRVFSSEVQAGYFAKFPDNPKYNRMYNEPSTTLVLPRTQMSLPLEMPVAEFAAIDRVPGKTFFVYAHVEYEDVRTHERHWTHYCTRHSPTTAHGHNGFVECRTYNDAN